MKRCLLLPLAFLWAAIGSGCAATRCFSSASRLETIRPKDELVDTYFVEDVSFSVLNSPLGQWEENMLLRRGEVNKALQYRFPSVFKDDWDSIPLHCKIVLRPVSESRIPFLPLLVLTKWETQCWEIQCELAIDNSSSIRAFVPFRQSNLHSLVFPIPFLVPEPHDFPVSHNLYPLTWNGHNQICDVLTDLAGTAIVDSLNRATAGQLAQLRGQSHATAKQREARQDLLKSSATTIRTDGTSFIESDISWDARPVDVSILHRIPILAGASYEEETRIGTIRADVSKSDLETSRRYLLERLIPAICKTKAVVLDPLESPPENAMFRILEDSTDESGIRTISFQSLE